MRTQNIFLAVLALVSTACTGGTIPFESTLPSETATTSTTTTTMPQSPVATDLVMWLDANATSTITSVAGAVSAWADKTTNANNALQPTGISQPSVNVGGLNSKNTISFDGVDDFLVVADSATTKPAQLSIFIVAKIQTWNWCSPFINKTSDYSWTTDGYGMNATCADTNNTAFWVNTYYTTVEKNSFLVPVNTFHIYVGTYNLTHSRFYVDGTPLGSEAEAGTLNHTTRPMTIGMNYASTTTTTTFDALHGQIAEILIYQSSLSAANRQLVEGYLANKWGLQSVLPNGHPYKP